MATGSFAKQVGWAVIRKCGRGGNKHSASTTSTSSSWYSPLMAAASRAISHRIPLVDFVLDVRDARVPLSSQSSLLNTLSSSSSRRILVLNKIDLANRSQVKDWTRYFQRQNFMVFCVNAHNNHNIQQFLNFLQGQVRVLKRAEPERHTITMMLVGITNVGKSALANALHKIGRITATEKGKLKHAIVSPLPGETKSINSFKVASHPSIYVLDTPGILPPQILDAEVCAKLALTGALRDSLAGEKALAQYFLSVLNLSCEYQKWEKVLSRKIPSLVEDDNMTACKGSIEINRMEKEKFLADHTKDAAVLNVRTSLVEAISSFRGNLHDEEDMLKLIQAQFRVLQEAFSLEVVSEEVRDCKVAAKLLNLYRTGRLGHYTLDSLPINKC